MLQSDDLSVSRRRSRTKLAIVLTAAAYLLVIFQLFKIQILDHEYYSECADAQHTRSVVLDARRGKIYDRNDFLLAGNRSVVSFEIYWPNINLENSEELAAINDLVETLECWSVVNAPVQRTRINQILAVNVPLEVARPIIENPLPAGINWRIGCVRTYPLGDRAANILGRISSNGNERLESKLDYLLSGSPGQKIVERSAYPGFSLPSLNEDQISPEDGVNIRLTIDSRFQCIVQDELERAVNESGAEWGAAIIVNPSNGNILAMGSYPVRTENGSIATNHCISGYHEPGSTFKLITLIACLEEKLVESSDAFDCSRGQIAVADRTISDCHEFGILTVAEIFIHSSNVGTIMMANLLDNQTLFDYCSKFGFGSPTGIELPNESAGILKNPREWSAVSSASISIGQEVTVTPLQLAMAYTVVANGGILYQPRFVDASQVDGEWKTWAVLPYQRIISEETAAEVRSILEDVVKCGTGASAAITGVTVAGKTGTAERLVYGDESYLSAFVGMIPAECPEIVAVIVFDRPDYEYRFGNSLAAPVFSRMIGSILAIEPELALGIPRNHIGEFTVANARNPR